MTTPIFTPTATVARKTCRACGAEIRWNKTPAGKWTPVNVDGTPHWSTCHAANDFRKKAQPKETETHLESLKSELAALHANVVKIKARILEIKAEVLAVAP